MCTRYPTMSWFSARSLVDEGGSDEYIVICTCTCSVISKILCSRMYTGTPYEGRVICCVPRVDLVTLHHLPGHAKSGFSREAVTARIHPPTTHRASQNTLLEQRFAASRRVSESAVLAFQSLLPVAATHRRGIPRPPPSNLQPPTSILHHFTPPPLRHSASAMIETLRIAIHFYTYSQARLIEQQW